MIKNMKKLEMVEKTLVDWLIEFDKDSNYKLVSDGVSILVVEGLRDLEVQKKYFATGKSKTMNSKHLKNKNGKSQAIDIVFERNGVALWNDMTYWGLASKHFSEYMKNRGIKATWGGDWNKNGRYTDERFLDAPHFQLDETPKNNDITILKEGMKSDDVLQLQRLLINKGYKLVDDGDFGNNTKNAVIDFQKKNGLNPDGIVGENTYKLLK